MTLIELLVVVSIMLIVTVIAVPAMKPALENRKIREAARAVNVYLSSARNRAIELGRPVGVLFLRDQPPGTPVPGALPTSAPPPYPPQYGNPCLTLQQVEIPATYAGDSTNAAVAADFLRNADNSINCVQNADNTITYTVVITFIQLNTFNTSTNQPQTQPVANVFHVGDYIQLGYQGLLYQITYIALGSPSTTITGAKATITMPPGCTVPLPTPCIQYAAGSTAGLCGVPFQIARWPSLVNTATVMAQSAVAPLQLPAGTAIDLQVSGWQTPGPNAAAGIPGQTFNANLCQVQPILNWSSLWFNGSYMSQTTGWTPNPVVLIFSPTGSVYGIYANSTISPVLDPVYLLIGRRDRMFSLTTPSGSTTLGSNMATVSQAADTREPLPPDNLANWQDPNNLWVSVTPQTGRITTVENAVVNSSALTTFLNASNHIWADAIVDPIAGAHRFALLGQSKGGR